MATEPASVAVNTPRRTPPIMMIGRHSGSTAGRKDFQNMEGCIFSVRSGR